MDSRPDTFTPNQPVMANQRQSVPTLDGSARPDPLEPALEQEPLAVNKNFAWHLAMFLSRPAYAVFVAFCTVALVWPGSALAVKSTPAWRLLLEMTMYEIVLVDVLCKRHINWHRPTQPRNGFPSGHATYGFALAWMTGLLIPSLLLPCLLAAMAVAWGRYHLKAHYLYQIVAGAGMGTALTYFVLWR